jgi:hypothetical protein
MLCPGQESDLVGCFQEVETCVVFVSGACLPGIDCDFTV